MQSTAPDVPTYLAEVPAARQASLTRLRELCLELLPGYVEGMLYGMPSYSKAGVVEVGFASQKQYVALYSLKQEVLAAHRERLRGLSVGKGCIRYRTPDAIDFTVVRDLLAGTRDSATGIC
jgi:uncharacterized protein YdhG (YjbR/CyaY superfamily)